VHLLGEPLLEPVGLHVDPGPRQAPVRRVLGVGLRADAPSVRRALAGEAVVLGEHSEDAGPLEPFLQAGSSVALVPLGPPGAIRGLVVVVSLDPLHPLDQAIARTVRRLTAAV
jgi:hypothetical protein